MHKTLKTITIATVLVAGFAIAALLGYLPAQTLGGIALALCSMILMHVTHPDTNHKPNSSQYND